MSAANVSSENTVAAIRPKTVRFKPIMNPNRAPPASVSSQADNPSEKVSKSDSKPTIYKPQAKLVSKATVSLLANMGNFNVSHDQQQTPTSVEAGVQGSIFEPNIPSQLQTDETTQNHQVEEDIKSLVAAAASSGDRPSYDGYNWRKYGQKQVKGSEYPRSYYKCTHPTCPVKKKVERSWDGQIAEIVYRGEHNHSKPQPAPKRNSSSGPGGGGHDASTPLWSSSNQVVNERNESCEGRIENENEVGMSHEHAAAVGTGSMNNVGGMTSDNSCGVTAECEQGSKALMEGDEDQEPKTKRRKSEIQSNEAAAGLSGEAAAQGTENVVGDGFRWRKYGQKVVKGNLYPRSYYRCTGPKCNVRKYVERVLDDPTGAFITTYEGKHNHDMPVRPPTISEPTSNPRTLTTAKP